MKKEISAGGVVFYKTNDKFYFLLLKYPSYWGLPKGKIEFGESDIKTALREIKEETGLKVKIIPGFKEKTTFFYSFKGEKILKEVIWFLAEADNMKVKISYEHEDYIWLPYPEVLDKITFDNDKKLVEKAMRFLKKIYQNHNKK